MTEKYKPLLQLLVHPDMAPTLELAQWDGILRQARSAHLLPRLAVLIKEQGLLDALPVQISKHLKSECIIASTHAKTVRRELNHIYEALAALDAPLVILKGAAYVISDLPPAKGRIFSDIDIMVPKDILERVESRLLIYGWASLHKDPYDQRYYRKWMHELPPLHHIKYKATLDVHHTILPETARLHPDPAKLFAAATTVQGTAGKIKVLAPTDMVLHSATHLFHDGELEHGLRDLVDLDALLRHFGKEQGFWQMLIQRAVELDLSRPLYYALYYTRGMLNTPVPDELLHHAAIDRPGRMLPLLMNALFMSALAPDHASCNTWFTPLARWLLYVRSHYLRMPLHLLLPHLLRKAFIKQKGAEAG